MVDQPDGGSPIFTARGSATEFHRLNICMINKHANDPTDDQQHRPWMVELALRVADHKQQQAVDRLGVSLVHEIVRLFLTVLMPEVQVLEPPGEPIRRICFPTRTMARRFMAQWGGRMVESHE